MTWKKNARCRHTNLFFLWGWGWTGEGEGKGIPYTRRSSYTSFTKLQQKICCLSAAQWWPNSTAASRSWTFLTWTALIVQPVNPRKRERKETTVSSATVYRRIWKKLQTNKKQTLTKKETDKPWFVDKWYNQISDHCSPIRCLVTDTLFERCILASFKGFSCVCFSVTF